MSSLKSQSLISSVVLFDLFVFATAQDEARYKSGYEAWQEAIETTHVDSTFWFVTDGPPAQVRDAFLQGKRRRVDCICFCGAFTFDDTCFRRVQRF